MFHEIFKHERHLTVKILMKMDHKANIKTKTLSDKVKVLKRKRAKIKVASNFKGQKSVLKSKIQSSISSFMYICIHKLTLHV